MTSGVFTSWVAHAGIAVVLASAALLSGEKKTLENLETTAGGRKSLLKIFLSISSLMAVSNVLASLSFQLGAPIAAVYMVKRILPASYNYWRREGKLDLFHGMSLLMTVLGAVLMVI